MLFPADMLPIRRLIGHPIAHGVGIVAALGLSCLLIFAQVRAVHQLREEALPALSRLPALTARLTALEEQKELMELQRALASGAQDEAIRAYVLPDGPELDRLLSLLDVITQQLEKEGEILHVSPIRVGEAEVDLSDATLEVYPVEMELTMTDAGKDTFLDLIRLSGLLTVSDALPAEETAMLLKLTEQENPAGIAALEQSFLSVDLLRYAREHKALQGRLLVTFPSNAFADSLAAVESSVLLSDARRLLAGDLGDVLQKQNLWPMRLLDVDQAAVERMGEGRVSLSVKLKAYARKTQE